MKTSLKWLLVLLCGVALGIVSASVLIRNSISAGSVHNGPWHTNADIGSAEADMYLRAAISIVGLLGLRREEVIYFSAQTDSDGQPLISGCNYEVSGTPPDARWWSITVYGADSFLIDNERDLYAASRANLEFAENGSFSFRLGRTAQAGHWIPTAAAGDPLDSSFDLTLRVYNPAKSVYQNLATTALPHITRLECSHG